MNKTYRTKGTFDKIQREEIMKLIIKKNIYESSLFDFVTLHYPAFRLKDGKILTPRHWLYQRMGESLQNTNNAMICVPRRMLKTYMVINSIILDLIQHPEKTILIITARVDLGVQILQSVKKAFISSKSLLSTLFPNYLVTLQNKFQTNINESVSLTTITTANRSKHNQGKDPNVRVQGVEMDAHGGRADKIIIEDPLGRKYRDSPSYKVKIDNALNDLNPILEEGGCIKFIGTRWVENDFIQQVLNFNSNIDKFSDVDENENPMFEDKWDVIYESIYKKGTEKPICDYVMGKREINKKKRTYKPRVFQSQYMNNPIPDESRIFHIDKYSTYSDVNAFDIVDVSIGIDLSVGRSKTADKQALVVCALTTDNKILLLDAFMKVIPTYEFRHIVKEYYLKWNKYPISKVNVESVSAFQDTVDWWRKDFMEENFYIPIIPVTPGRQSKANRFEILLGEYLEEEKILLPEYENCKKNDHLFTLIYNELANYDKFLTSNDDDGIDAFYYAVMGLLNTDVKHGVEEDMDIKSELNVYEEDARYDGY